MESENRILFIHYYFPPVGTVGTFRNYNIALELSRYFRKSYLITLKNKPFLQEETFDTSFIEIHEVNNFDYRNLYERLSKNRDLNDRVNANKGKVGAGLISRLLDTFPGNVIWGEGGLIYLVSAYRRAARLIRSEGITHIYSSFRPFTDHYIAYRLKRRFPELVWVADFRDLVVDGNRGNVFFPHWQDRMYTKILGMANILTTVSEGLSKKLKTYNQNVLVVRNGIRRLFIPENPQMPEKFTISYTGSLYPNLQDPTPLFKSIFELMEKGIIQKDKIQLVYAGKDHRIWEGYIQEFGLKDISVNKGKVSLTESIRLQHESHVNILLTWSGPKSGGVLTGKLYEYIAALKPVIGIIKGKIDEELLKIFEDTNLGNLVENNNSILITQLVKDLYIDWSNGGENNQKIIAEETVLSWKKNIERIVTYSSFFQ